MNKKTEEPGTAYDKSVRNMTGRQKEKTELSAEDRGEEIQEKHIRRIIHKGVRGVAITTGTRNQKPEIRSRRPENENGAAKRKDMRFAAPLLKENDLCRFGWPGRGKALFGGDA